MAGNKAIKESSVPHERVGGDSHLHPYPSGATATDRFEKNVTVRTDFDANGNTLGTRIGVGNKEYKIEA